MTDDGLQANFEELYRGPLCAQLLHEGLQVVLEVRQVLTPEQRAKVARLRDRLRTWQGALAAPSPGQKGKVR